jgi:inner membrane protein
LPTIFSHAVAAIGIGSVILPRHSRATLWAAGIVCSMLPDADVIGFQFGIGYGSMLGHRGLTHSLLFAALLSFAVTFAFFNNPPPLARVRIALFLFVATASHGLLDAFTNGGLGIAFFAPFDDERFFFPARPIAVSPIGTAFFSARGLDVLRSELLWVWLPALTLVAIASAVRFRARPR